MGLLGPDITDPLYGSAANWYKYSITILYCSVVKILCRNWINVLTDPYDWLINVRYWSSEIYPAFNKDIDNEWWFNSESQLQIICRYNNISIFDMTPKISGLSLYNYNKNNYFDKDNNLINNPENIFFICRN